MSHHTSSYCYVMKSYCDNVLHYRFLQLSDEEAEAFASVHQFADLRRQVIIFLTFNDHFQQNIFTFLLKIILEM